MDKKNTITVCTGVGLNMFFPEYVTIEIPVASETVTKPTKKTKKNA